MTEEEQAALLRAELEAALAAVARRWAGRFEIVSASVTLALASSSGRVHISAETRR